jgi:hypothetical protein
MLVDDLRTTDRPQGRMALRTTDGDCCLGRACEVYKRETGEGEWVAVSPKALESYHSAVRNKEPQAFKVRGFNSDRDPAVLPHEVAEWYGFSDINPSVSVRSMATATELNDNARLTFAQIADAFERTYLQ